MDNSFILVINKKKHRDPLKVCNKINKMFMSLTTWMKKCADYVQFWIKHVSREGNVVGFFWGNECDGAPEWPLGFATALNMWDLAGCLEPYNLHCHPSTTSYNRFWFCHNLNPQSSSLHFSKHFPGFLSYILMV